MCCTINGIIFFDHTVSHDITLTDSESLFRSILKDISRYSVFPFHRIMLSKFDEINSPVYPIKRARGKGALYAVAFRY